VRKKRVKGRSPLRGIGAAPQGLEKGGFEMEIKCYKMLDGRGKVYLPAALREAAGFGKNDVLQLTGRGGVILLNKADISADDPVELLQAGLRLENELAAGERETVKKRMKQLLDEGKDLDDALDEALRFLF
jgi:bifunctional DNA-binding transcriptional regulator/antitoxin component of YhaV-PrlF toxin-antitoxin module